MNPSVPLSRSRSARRTRRSAGFTLIETMITVGIAGILSGIAYPSLEGQVMRARRTDAFVALLQAQLAQERFRANNASYGSLADVGVRPTSPSGHYRLEVVSSDATGFELLASAVAGQARDTRCRHLRLAFADATLTYASGSDASTANSADANRACWGR
jgi:type IV pilus assembly protein PilE